MKLRTLFLLIVLLAITAFAALNWSVFITPTTLSLGVTDVQAPLGLVMIGIVALLTVLFLVFVVYLQTSILLETRRHAQELHANRALADKAEASRFSELRAFLDAELKKQVSLDSESRAAVLTRVDLLDRDLRYALEQSVNTLAAYIGELEDRLEKDPKTAEPVQPG